jgi:hypothetical protein
MRNSLKIPKYTLRKWNPKKLNDENNDEEAETVCMLCSCLPCATCVDKCFSAMISETVEYVSSDPRK